MANKRGFTLIELMVVIIIIGIIAAFAIPNYTKSIAKAHERDAKLQLSAINAANTIYRAQTNSYWVSPTAAGLDDINSNLNLNIIANNLVYQYSSDATGTTYETTAAYTDGTNNFTLKIRQGAISASNPCCASASCLTVTVSCP